MAQNDARAYSKLEKLYVKVCVALRKFRPFTKFLYGKEGRIINICIVLFFINGYKQLSKFLYYRIKRAIDTNSKKNVNASSSRKYFYWYMGHKRDVNTLLYILIVSVSLWYTV